MLVPRWSPALGGLAASVLVLAACGGTGDGDQAAAPLDVDDAVAAEEAAEATASTDSQDAADAGLAVTAAFYPLQYLVEQVGGERVDVTGLTPPGAEAHDLELSPQALAGLQEADLLVLLDGFQPAVDDAVGASDVTVLDLAPVADRPYGEDAGPHDHGDEDHADDEHSDEHSDEPHSDEDEHGHGHGDTDPHFWTDPTHMLDAAGLVAAELSTLDPEGAETYEANLAVLEEELTALDEQAQAALQSCEVDVLVTAHDAFGYFADRYGFEVRSINGLTPDQEPDARALGEIADFVEDNGVTTVYTETLVSSAVADTVAAEAGVATSVLDPVEGLTDESAAQDYVGVMEANIEAVRSGQACG
ncbi:metal ABC transporter substrate-binding protein [Aquipuribacter nitratireducens]|uniref:Metal ABC transporter substrate-binding protein n=1 Tax=Aquipuribacter nitratireducens TaxID=650104 RepID=A0ABW0GMK3_9MICO